MNKSALILKIHGKLKQFKIGTVKEAVDLFFDEVKGAMMRDERVELRGFGTFCLHAHSAKLAYNPRTGQRFYMSPKKVAYFRASDKVLEKLNK